MDRVNSLNHKHDFLNLKHLVQRVRLFYASKVLLWLIICFGMGIRLAGYLTGRSLWLDEARLALNIVNRSFLQLLQPLDYKQGAPVGFLLIEKVMVLTFGNNEYSLRLIPFLAGIVSLLIFYNIATHYLKTRTMPIALGLFAISMPLIYYSSEVKQYSSDVAIGLLLYWTTIFIQNRFSPSRMVLFGIIGAIAVWFSHPAIFILGGVAISLTSFCLVKRKWRKCAWLAGVYSLWALSFVALYFVSLRDLSANEDLLDYWSGSFMPFPPLSFSNARWFINTFLGIFGDPVGLKLTGIAVFTFLMGSLSMFYKKRKEFFILIIPILLALLASGFHLYPFKGRLLLFIVPAILILIVAGIEQIRSSTKAYSMTIVIILVSLVFLHPLISISQYLVGDSRLKQEIKPVISYVNTHQQDEDILYLYYGAQDAFRYYQEKYGYHDNDYIVGVNSRDNWNNYTDDLDKLRGHRRVWILFSHIFKSKDVDEEKFFLYYLDRIGTKLDTFKAQGASVYLYDLSTEHRLQNLL